MAENHPAQTRATAYEANPNNPGAVIRLALSPSGNPRAMTVAEARAFIAQIEAAITVAESGQPLPAVPKRTRWTPRTKASTAALPAA